METPNIPTAALFKDESKRTIEAVEYILRTYTKNRVEQPVPKFTTIEFYTALGLIRNKDARVFFWQHSDVFNTKDLCGFARAVYTMSSKKCLDDISTAAIQLCPRIQERRLALLEAATLLLTDPEPRTVHECNDAIAIWKALKDHIVIDKHLFAKMELQPLLILMAAMIDTDTTSKHMWAAVLEKTITTGRDDIQVARNLDMLFSICESPDQSRAKAVLSEIGQNIIKRFEGCGLDASEEHFVQLVYKYDIDPDWVGGKEFAAKRHASVSLTRWLRGGLQREKRAYSDDESEDESDEDESESDEDDSDEDEDDSDASDTSSGSD